MKGKLIGIGILVPICGIASIFLSSLIHLMMSQQWTGTSQLAWGLCIERIKMDKQVGMIALTVFVMSIAILAMLIFMLGSNKTSFKPELRTITDKISTPIPYGERQHGSARWLKSEEYKNAFAIASVSFEQEPLATLCSQGKEDLSFCKPKKEEVKFEKKAETEKGNTNKGKSKPTKPKRKKD